MGEKIIFKQNLNSTVIEWQVIGKACTFLASILNNQPSEDLVDYLRRAYERKNCVEGDAGYLIYKFFQDNQHQPTPLLAQKLKVEWTRLFRGLSPTYGPKPPYANVYLSADNGGMNKIADIAGIYANHELEIPEGRHNRLDYLGIQLDFLSILSGKIAQESRTDNFTVVGTLKNELLNFLQKYILPWTDDFLAAAEGYTKTDFFRGYLNMLKEVLTETHTLLQQ